tara:strand:- start:354 stop:938 length:585 start_codon:yes stop_codon:yes gene_type:complete
MSVFDQKPKLLSLLPKLGYAGIEILARYLVSSDLSKGDVLIKQGSSDADVFFLLDGNFSVFEKIQIDGEDIVLHTANFSAPAVIGEINILNETERTASVVATSESKCLVLTKEQFDALVLQHPTVIIELLISFGSLLCERQINFQHKVRSIILSESSSLAKRLSKLSKFTGKASKVSSTLTKTLFKEDFTGRKY